jgi:hypothetical protein
VGGNVVERPYQSLYRYSLHLPSSIKNPTFTYVKRGCIFSFSYH